MQGITLALIGGGRWARVHATVLCSLAPPIARLLWVSRHNREAIERALIAREHPQITLLDSIDEVLDQQLDAAIVCTATANHGSDALAVLESGTSVLVEKPIALD
ncbi:MAG: Gfo/Idh/MocA family oxidoreductase, partial [Alphaproteobacteria bacterium]|nr:Gfo/Idh/MocA family oxidoreductase [Alphaproteobacteria bacterium]